jgi:multiple sugar transport system ATP-binding protein
VNIVEPMGDETFLYIQIGNETYTVKVEEDVIVQEGETIQITAPEDKIHLFDADTGETVMSRLSGIPQEMEQIENV